MVQYRSPMNNIQKEEEENFSAKRNTNHIHLQQSSNSLQRQKKTSD